MASRGHSPTVIHSWDVPATPRPGSLPHLRTLIAAFTLATATTLGSTAYAVPTEPTSVTTVATPEYVYYADNHYSSFCEVDENS